MNKYNRKTMIKLYQNQRGMAATEYIVVTAAVAIGLMSVSGGGATVKQLTDALINYYSNYSFAISLPTP